LKASTKELKKVILENLKELSKKKTEKRIEERIEKFSVMGAYSE
jgi:acetyl-CoA carboxylase carboxyl transferase subunit alpha